MLFFRLSVLFQKQSSRRSKEFLITWQIQTYLDRKDSPKACKIQILNLHDCFPLFSRNYFVYLIYRHWFNQAWCDESDFFLKTEMKISEIDENYLSSELSLSVLLKTALKFDWFEYIRSDLGFANFAFWLEIIAKISFEKRHLSTNSLVQNLASNIIVTFEIQFYFNGIFRLFLAWKISIGICKQ